MRFGLAIAAGFVWAASSIVAAPAALAQQAPPPTGTIDAREYAPLPAGDAIAVVMDQDTDQYERLKAAIETALRNRGYRVSDDGPLMLEFYGSEVIGSRPVDRAANAPANRSLAPVPAHDANLGLLTGLNHDLFGDTGSAPDQEPGVGRQVSLSMTLSVKSTAARLWQGSAMGRARSADSFAATKSLVPFLVSALGRSENNQKFDMP
ncbi:MAG TPA: hypothetical protein VMF53_02005 [Alphaproteobacteria bacterium]|nr:hypothetical protein [Alphaproteobacteria bacterium]